MKHLNFNFLLFSMTSYLCHFYKDITIPMFGCQIICLDEELLEIFLVPVHVPDIIEKNSNNIIHVHFLVLCLS